MEFQSNKKIGDQVEYYPERRSKTSNSISLNERAGRTKSLNASTSQGVGQVKMKFDQKMAPGSNPNAMKSMKVIDARIGEEKARFTKARKKLERRFEKNFNKWREYDLLTCIIALLGLAMAIVDWEYTSFSTRKIISDHSTILCTD